MVSRTRLSGFNAPFDVDETVQKLMKIERMKMDRLESKKTTIQYKRDDYLLINKSLLTLQGKANDMKYQANFNKMTTSVSDTSIVSASASSYATDATYNVKVNKVATRADILGGNLGSGTIDTSAKLNTLKPDGATNIPTGTYQFEVNGVKINVDTEKDSLNDVLNRINTSGAGVTALYDSTNKQIKLTANKAGLVNGASKDQDEISIVDKSGAFANDILKITSGAGATVGKATGSEFEINGIVQTSKTNELVVNNTTFTAQKESTSAITVEVKRDVQAMVDKIKDFVKTYNDTLGLINIEYNEKHNKSYAPLTSEQRKEMSEKDVELWDVEAKKGMLYRDTTIGSIRSHMKSFNVATFSVGGQYDSLASIGITSTKYDGSSFNNTDGLLVVDEEKLKKALTEDPDSVMKVFTNISSNSNEQGLAQRVSEMSLDYMSKIKGLAGFVSSIADNSTLGMEYKRALEQIDRFEASMEKIEDGYYRKFSFMEQMMQRYQSQSAAFG
ncbi:flagellar filament capping protein FliD [Brevibacillus parabrevis]|uniref:flagellar filament capping protein FliD n=1 Tax=Brevibacillus parabrevis TaxID=54914 RepID=UPI0028D48BF3|nr:flagellar filament capping protein FliD [Brevibacillus parabrevis]